METVMPRRATMERVRSIIGEPDEMIRRKILDHLDAYCQLFIAHSPYCCLATASGDGTADCSPRGDEPGFVRVLDERTLVIPDRPGNQLADSFSNITQNPAIGMLFLIPGYAETLRVNGQAYPTDDPQLMPMLQARGRTPQLATVIEVEQAFLHCAKANIRSGLWESGRQGLATLLPSGGTIAAAHMRVDGVTVADFDDDLAHDYRTNL